MIKTRFKFLKLLVLLIFTFALTPCASTTSFIKNTQDGESFTRSSKGLLLGALHWKQGDDLIPASKLSTSYIHCHLLVKDIRTNHIYAHSLKEPYFFLSLSPGQYRLIAVSVTAAGNLSHVPFNTSPDSSRAAETATMFVAAMGGCYASPHPQVLYIPGRFSSFEIRQREATYVGALIIELPDPIPSGPVIPSFHLKDEADQILKNYQIRFPGIERVNRYFPET